MELDDEIRKAVESIPGISVLVVFGSRARGTHRPDSDLDVAVLPDGTRGGSRWHLQADIAVALEHLSRSPEGRVDVVLLADGGALVSWIERTGEKEAQVRVRRVGPDDGWRRAVRLGA